MKEISIKLHLPHGLHMRPAGIFVKEAARYKSKITIFNGDMMADGKSIMGLLTLALGPGSVMRIVAEGPDEEEAIIHLKEVVHQKLDEVESVNK